MYHVTRSGHLPVKSVTQSYLGGVVDTNRAISLALEDAKSRASPKVTFDEMAAKTKISSSSLKRYFAGTRPVSLADLFRIAPILGTTASWIVRRAEMELRESVTPPASGLENPITELPTKAAPYTGVNRRGSDEVRSQFDDIAESDDKGGEDIEQESDTGTTQ